MTLPVRTAHDGLELPAIGFGTYRVQGLEGKEAIKSALASGYRLIDSAVNYENEGAVGAAVRESGVPREDVIVTSKLPGRHHAYDEALTCIEESVLRMGLGYIDLSTSSTGPTPPRAPTSRRGGPSSRRSVAGSCAISA